MIIMTKAILEKITIIEDLLYFSKAYKEGLININISKLARELGKDFKTVKRYLNGETPKKTRNRVKYLDEHREYILEVLSDKNRSFDYMDHLFKYLKREKEITCTRTTLSRYIHNDEELSKYFKRQKEAKFTERFETKPGEQAQFDLKERVKTIDESGNVTYVNIPTLTLSWSRFNYRDLIIDMKTEVLLSFLARAFEHIGGVGEEWLDKLVERFESDYSEFEFESGSGKKGVQVVVDHSQKYRETVSFHTMNFDSNHVFFTEAVNVNELARLGLLLDISDTVDEQLKGEENSILEKFHEQHVSGLNAFDGNYYAIPHYSLFNGINYNIDLFDDYGFYISDEYNTDVDFITQGD